MANEPKPYGRHSLNRIIEDAIKDNWERMALSDFGGGLSYKFSETAEYVEKLHILYRAAGVVKYTISRRNGRKSFSGKELIRYLRG